MMIKTPFKFIPILKEKIWGGNKLNTLLNKSSNKQNIGESWEISNVEGNISVVSTGKDKGKTITELIYLYKDKLVGKKIYDTFGTKFPLLIKYIDAKESLSIQLHPNDELAKKRHNSFGKTEMWYVMQAENDGKLIVGFKKKVDAKTYQRYLSEKKLLDILNEDKVTHGDVYFIPTGRVHAIEAGVLLAEIQQTSDITYRIYDWDRKDSQGNSRELHTEYALDALDFSVKNNYKTNYKAQLNKTIPIVDCPFFTTNMLLIDGTVKKNQEQKDSFIIYMCVKGNVTFANNNFKMDLKYGETILIPNCISKYEISSQEESELLEVYIN